MTAAATEEQTSDEQIDERVCHTYCCVPGYAFCGYREDNPRRGRKKKPPCPMCTYEAREYIAGLVAKYGSMHKAWLAHKTKLEHHRSCPNYKD
jgi:hypothetical protein